MVQRFAILALLPLAGCALPVTHQALRAPNPNGCYAIVYEQPSFGGRGDVLNGPTHLTSLAQVPGTNAGNWHKRIRSLRVGSSATITVYVAPAFKGRSQQFGPAKDHPQLDQMLSARIQSLDVACVDRPTVRP